MKYIAPIKEIQITPHPAIAINTMVFHFSLCKSATLGTANACITSKGFSVNLTLPITYGLDAFPNCTKPCAWLSTIGRISSTENSSRPYSDLRLSAGKVNTAPSRNAFISCCLSCAKIMTPFSSIRKTPARSMSCARRAISIFAVRTPITLSAS